MTMVPGVSVLESAPSVCEGVSLSNRTLSDTIDTVHLIRVELPDAMPVHCSTIFVVVVFHMNHNLISPTGLYYRGREGIVEDFARRLVESVGCELYGNVRLVMVLSHEVILTGNPDGLQEVRTHRYISVKLNPILFTKGQYSAI